MTTTATNQHCPRCDKVIESHLMRVEPLGLRSGHPCRSCSVLCLHCKAVYSLIQVKQGLDEWQLTGEPLVETAGKTFEALMRRHHQFTGQ